MSKGVSVLDYLVTGIWQFLFVVISTGILKTCSRDLVLWHSQRVWLHKEWSKLMQQRPKINCWVLHFPYKHCDNVFHETLSVWLAQPITYACNFFSNLQAQCKITLMTRSHLTLDKDTEDVIWLTTSNINISQLLVWKHKEDLSSRKGRIEPVVLEQQHWCHSGFHCSTLHFFWVRLG